MRKSLLVGCAVAVLLVSGGSCYAEFESSTCFSTCGRDHAACIAKIDALNEMELRDQKAACDNAKSECYNVCDAMRENETQQMRLLKQQQEEQQQGQPPQDPPPQDPDQQQQDQPQDQPPQ